MRTVARCLLVVFVAALFALPFLGCAAGEAGRATSPVDARLIVEWPAAPFPLADAGLPNLTITATQTVTITPTSSATQTATASPEVDAEIPVNITPGSGTSLEVPK